ncbi:hypothetical protein MUN46_005420 [Mesosutterella sp. AGMB02718]|uniref:Uncharacterized protein n=1 Tax=Mesosutterella faecium TaxID=2925194 RepID=A0ABT7IN40_9BURK|nr:hypothetical protein [Mesosutterella sp. AGMB02718]MDL2059370.1 hypothetical protein [Mesosutterella sp. AGMB02718]
MKLKDMELVAVEKQDLTGYKAAMQEAFQKGFEAKYGPSEKRSFPTWI